MYKYYVSDYYNFRVLLHLIMINKGWYVAEALLLKQNSWTKDMYVNHKGIYDINRYPFKFRVTDRLTPAEADRYHSTERT